MWDSIIQGLSGMNVAGLANVAGNMFASRQAAIAATRQANSFADAASLDFAAFQDRINEIGRGTMQGVGERAEQTLREMGKLNAILADSGTTGTTSQRLRAEILREAAQDTAAIQANGRSAIRQTGRQIQSSALGYSSRIDAIQSPSGWGTVLSNIGGLFPTSKQTVKVGDVINGVKK